MKSNISCGGIVIYRGKILVLYKNYNHRYDGWVLPKGTVEDGEEYRTTALREVKEEGGADCSIVDYVGETHFTFESRNGDINKTVHWFLMMADSFYTRPQRCEGFESSGFYKYIEAYHLLKFDNEKEILKKAYEMYLSYQDRW